MKKGYLISIGVLFIIIVLSYSFTIFYYKYERDSLFYGNELQKIEESQYHFVCIAQNTDDPFWQSVEKGTFDAARDYKIALEFNGPRYTNIDEELQCLEIAIASKVDGIVTHVLDEKRFLPVINKAIEQEIPVITIDSDANKSKRISFIGTNNFQFGEVGGKLISEATNGKAKVAIILNSYGDGIDNISGNLKVTGFTDFIRKNQYDIEIKTIKSSNMGLLSASEVTSEIINQFPDVNAIFCTSPNDTLGVAQVIVDLNKVGDIKIVGCGSISEILRYVEIGVIHGTVVSNPYNMGYQSIRILTEIKKKNMTTDYVDTGVQGISVKNLDQYRKSTEDEKEVNTLK